MGKDEECASACASYIFCNVVAANDPRRSGEHDE